MSIWDDPELQTADNYIKFENVGDTVSGVIQTIRAHRFDDGSVAPQLILADANGEEIAVTAGQIRLKNELVQKRPNPGDHITITYTQKEPRAGGKTLKHFQVDVRPNFSPQGGQAVAPAPQQQAPAQQFQQPQQGGYGQPAYQAPAPQQQAQDNPWGGAPAQQAPQQQAPAPAPAAGPQAASEEQVAKARQFFGLGLSDEDIAGATGLSLPQVAALRNLP